MTFFVILKWGLKRDNEASWHCFLMPSNTQQTCSWLNAVVAVIKKQYRFERRRFAHKFADVPSWIMRCPHKDPQLSFRFTLQTIKFLINFCAKYLNDGIYYYMLLTLDWWFYYFPSIVIAHRQSMNMCASV